MKPSPIKETISFKDFEKLDIRVGKIISVSEVAKSNKLIRNLNNSPRLPFLFIHEICDRFFKHQQILGRHIGGDTAARHQDIAARGLTALG